MNYTKSFLAPGTGERIEVRGPCFFNVRHPLIQAFSPQGEKEPFDQHFEYKEEF
jgi:hypothetical protein